MFASHFATLFQHFSFGNPFSKVIAFNVFPVTLCSLRNISVPNAIIFKRFTEFGIEIYLIIGMSVAVSPATTFRRTFHPALDGPITNNLHILLGGSSANTASQINLNTRSFALRKRKTENSAVRCGCCFCQNMIIR